MLTREDGLELLRLAGIEIEIKEDMLLGEGIFIIESQKRTCPLFHLDNKILIVNIINAHLWNNAYKEGFEESKSRTKDKLKETLKDIDNDKAFNDYSEFYKEYH